MRVPRFIATAALALASSNTFAAGTIYKCKGGDGRVAFSDTPCAKDAETVRIPEGSPKKNSGLIDGYWCNDGPASKELVQACLDAWRLSLRDPHGAYADSGTMVSLQSDRKDLAVFIDGHAKNGFGGTSAMPMQCQVQEDGTINGPKTAEWVKLGMAFEGLHMERPPPHILECAQ